MEAYDFVFSIDRRQLLGDFLCPIGAVIVNDNNLPCKIAATFTDRSGPYNHARNCIAHFSLSVFARSQMITGRFFRSLYVGRMMLYL